MLQNPHRHQPEVHRIASKTDAGPIGATKFARHGPSSNSSAKKLAQRAIKRQFRPNLSAQGELFRAFTLKQRHRANFFALTPTPGRAGRKMSHSRRNNAATLKPPAPLLTRKDDDGFRHPGPPGRQCPDTIPVTGDATKRGELHYTSIRHADDTPPAGFV